MYKALTTIILEDVFGRDNLYLKGHTYHLTYSDWTVEDVGGRGIQAFHTHNLLSEEDMEEYFSYEVQTEIRGGHGNSIISTFKGRG